MVEKVKACYVFEVEGGEGKYYIDFKDGDGQVGEGEIPNRPSDFKPEVKITMSQENMLKMFNSMYLKFSKKCHMIITYGWESLGRSVEI